MNELVLYGVIGEEVSAVSVLDQLRNFGDTDNITVRINSIGGYAFDGYAIYNALTRHPAAIRVEIDGMAASAASIIAMAGDEIVMAESSQMMIHCAAIRIGLSNSYNAFEIETQIMPELTKVSAALKRIDNQLAAMYSARTGLKPETWLRMMEKETYFTAEEAVKKGLADAILPNKQKPEPKRRTQQAAAQSTFNLSALAAVAQEIIDELPEFVAGVPEIEEPTEVDAPEPVAEAPGEPETVNLAEFLAAMQARAAEVQA